MKRSKERDRESEKGEQPDKLEVICPLIYKLTSLAVNYDLTWQSETKMTVEDDDGFATHEATGCWKSTPVVRGHTDVFMAELDKMREADEISWEEKAYYFTQEEGVEARKAYEQAVLSGQLKAHITSWGPNPKKANDKSRFHKFTGVTFQELQEKYPALYTTQPKASTEPKQHSPKETPKVEEATAKEVVEETSSEDGITEPSDNELQELEEEIRVSAAASPEATISDIVAVEDQEDDHDDHTTIVLYVPEELTRGQRIDCRNESISWKSESGEEMEAFLMDLPEIGKEIWLSEGKYEIDGYHYEIRVEREE